MILNKKKLLLITILMITVNGIDAATKKIGFINALPAAATITITNTKNKTSCQNLDAKSSGDLVYSGTLKSISCTANKFKEGSISYSGASAAELVYLITHDLKISPKNNQIRLVYT